MRTHSVLIHGYHRLFTGAGQVRWELSKRLPAVMSHRPLRFYSVPNEPNANDAPLLRRFRAGLVAPDVVISAGTPLPLGLTGAAILPIIYDLRWRDTRGPVGRAYRKAELQRLLRRSCKLLTISETVAGQLEHYAAARDLQVCVLPMGPGQFQGYPIPAPHDSRTVILVGGARRKRNEEAAELLGLANRRAPISVIGASVSPATQKLLQRSIPSQRLTLIDRPDTDELHRAFTMASTYLALGTDEGFGLPYVEAAYHGCDIVTPCTALSREVVGPDGLLLAQTVLTPDILIGTLDAWELDRVIRLQSVALRRTWDDTALAVADVVDDVLH